MALLQIAEPGQSPQPHQRRLAVGIDLGTTNSLVAAVRSGRSEPLPDVQVMSFCPLRYATWLTTLRSARLRARRPPVTR